MLLNKTECTALRGLAITAIALHNYCHFIGGVVQENEYIFRQTNADRMLTLLAEADRLLPVHLLSFFGHYGVPLFLFLSGYGLVLKYETHAGTAQPQSSTCHFLRYHYLKLLRLLLVGLSLFVVVDVLTPGRFHFEWQHVVEQLTMVINFEATPQRVIWPGIYWFFGLMMQLYLVYRLLFYRRTTALAAGLVAACWLAQACCDADGPLLNWLRYNCVGAMLPFVAGIATARHKAQTAWSRTVWAAIAMTATLLMLPASLWFQTWLWAPLIAITASVALVKCLPQTLLTGAEWTGALSAVIFIIHPTTRKLLIGVAQRDGAYDGLVLYVLVTLTLAFTVRLLLRHIPTPRP